MELYCRAGNPLLPADRGIFRQISATCHCRTPHPGDQTFIDVSVAAARHGLEARHVNAIWEEGGSLSFFEGINYGLAEDTLGVAGDH